MIKMIAAVSQNGVMGKNNTLPWMKKYPSDLKRFKALTLDSSIIMGRKTWESIGCRALPRRTHFIVTSNPELHAKSEIITAPSLSWAIDVAQKQDRDIWIIGGASMYHAGMEFAEEIDLTIVPEVINTTNTVAFPWINPAQFRIDGMTPGEDGLLHVLYKRV